MAWAPDARSASTVCASAFASISASTSFMPSDAPFSANARPKPLAAPVITATLPSNSNMPFPSMSDCAWRVPVCADSDQLDELLAEVAPLEHAEKRFGCVFQALRDGLAILQLLLGDERAEFLQRGGPLVQMLADDEALNQQTLREKQSRMPERQRRAVVTRDEAAQRDAAMRVHPRERRVEHFAADVLEATVHAVRRRRLEVLIKIARLVVDACVEPQGLDHIAALVWTTRDADGAHARLLRQLSDDAADRSARRADDHRLARLRRDDPVQAVPRRHARHADGAEIRGEGHMRVVDLAQVLAVRRTEFLPAEHADHLVAGLESRVL